MLRAGITAQDVITGLHKEATHGEGLEPFRQGPGLGTWSLSQFVRPRLKTDAHKLSDLTDVELVQWIERIASGEDVPEFLQ